ncbi:DUF3102 domain-containing protein [Leptospira bandrabouensis]|uniref:DUF3102 domain-containing protein n=1 Tax=Leptospira bandrabouensis TaxID=2484903 RepID=UPI00223DF414|nr:DUF3102 domain-containing protein [Leptospira bandrabouensis]MCW7460136.1 DUF3102 domain-containing protein [Leptospira bandrabouensis]MCW7479347.1 DUF3102 domain-containing protein [Leptospira bandrabouensis]MCW7487029.1 DUF3102 domain-containing protein [Leptospira bandrabouensis]
MGRFDSLSGKRPGSQKENLPTIKTDPSVKRIIELHESIIGGIRNVLQNAMTLGEELSKIKENLGHGNWLPWLEENVPFSERSARNYINIYKNRDLLNRQPVADLKSAIKFLSDSPHDEKEINPKEIQDPKLLYKKFKSGDRLSSKDRNILKEFLGNEKQRVLEAAKKKVSEIDEDISALKF